nr:MAG TPA: hypothetical protein [Caudoviricetes sp.]
MILRVRFSFTAQTIKGVQCGRLFSFIKMNFDKKRAYLCILSQ